MSDKKEIDDIEDLKRRLKIAESKLGNRSKRIGVALVVFGIFFMIKSQFMTGLLIILIGVQFIF